MTIFLETVGNDEAYRVADLLRERGLSYNFVLVDTFRRPRVRIGSREFIGEAAIAAALAQIEKVQVKP